MALVNTKADEVAKAHGTPYTFQQLHMLRQIVRAADPQAENLLPVSSWCNVTPCARRAGRHELHCMQANVHLALRAACSVQSKVPWVSSVRYCAVISCWQQAHSAALAGPSAYQATHEDGISGNTWQATREDVDGRGRTGSTTSPCRQLA